MPSAVQTNGLTITNPLILYRSLLTTKRLDPDPAQHRLAIHLQKIYHRILDYEPEVEYGHRIKQLSRTIGLPTSSPLSEDSDGRQNERQRKGVFATLRARKEKAEAMALTRKLTDHEAAIQIRSPQGLLLYGEVGTGKSMLIDLLADCLPNKKKRRWHFNTFMLETFAKLEQLRRSRLVDTSVEADHQPEHSLLWLAKDMISTSPILFLDEFQLPDKAASKILSSLFASFFQLGGVLIATSNRMPEELANASGVEFAAPPSSQLGLHGNRWGILGAAKSDGKSRNMFESDFAAFLELLRNRCEIFQMEGSKDWRRHGAQDDAEACPKEVASSGDNGFEGLEDIATGNIGLGFEQSLHVAHQDLDSGGNKTSSATLAPKKYVIASLTASLEEKEQSNQAWASAVIGLLPGRASVEECPWESTSFRVYGRDLNVSCHFSGVTKWKFSELCCTNLGPADYITLASNFHTFILEDVPVLSLLHKNEARRLITLLDALYEARCRLLVRAAAGPDQLFFPETQQSRLSNHDIPSLSNSNDGVYPETFSEIYQDTTSPFRPNISSYASSASPPAYASSSFPSSSYSPAQSTRSILADEDSDFGPTYGAGRSAHGPSDGAPGAGNEIGRQSSPDFGRVGTFTGEDERFAYKRARSRLWELCSQKWWDKKDLWKPLSKDIRRWEGRPLSGVGQPSMTLPNEKSSPDRQGDEKLFRHGASLFRTAVDPPPKISWTHAWGMMQWGKKADAWGKGPEGLKDRKRDKDGGDRDP